MQANEAHGRLRDNSLKPSSTNKVKDLSGLAKGLFKKGRRHFPERNDSSAMSASLKSSRVSHLVKKDY